MTFELQLFKPIMNKHTPFASSHNNKNTSLLSFIKTSAKRNAEDQGSTMELAKQHQTINENTNCTNPESQGLSLPQNYDENSNQHAIGFHQAHFKKIADRVEQPAQSENSNNLQNSLTNPLPRKIMILQTNDQDTRRVASALKSAIGQQIKNEMAVQHTSKKDRTKKNHLNYVSSSGEQVSESATFKMQIPSCKKVEQILQKQPLRTRFSGLLKDDQKYQIGYEHMKLLKTLRTMDTTIQYLTMNRHAKFYFFTDLRKSIYQNNRMQLTYKQLQQLLFIDDTLFAVEWQHNQKIGTIDVMVTPPKIISEDQRISNTRKSIVKYLLAMEVEYLTQKNSSKVKIDGWSAGFDPNKYQIPLKSLPSHPFVKDAEIKGLSNNNIERVKNLNLKKFMKEIKDDSDAKSLRSDDVASMIFGKKSNACIKQKLYQAIREKQAKKAAADQCAKDRPIQKQIILKVCDQILMTYLSKKVSNIFKVTLIQTLNKKINPNVQIITQCLQTILSVKEIQFLKQITTSNKIVVIQINKAKFNQMIEYLKTKL